MRMVSKGLTSHYCAYVQKSGRSRILEVGRSPRFRAVSIPTSHNLFRFRHCCKAPSQLSDLLSHRIFHDLSFLDTEDEVLRGCTFESNDVKIDVPGPGPILFEGAGDASVQR